jgi:hypothetical protein
MQQKVALQLSSQTCTLVLVLMHLTFAPIETFTLAAKARSRPRVQDQGNVQVLGDSFIELII